MQPLPIDAVLPAVHEALRASPSLVIEAPPGAGKTTRVPTSLLAAVVGEVIVSEPRRLAARLAAARVAEERGEALGGTIGYSVRFENVTGPDTRVRYVTDGVLLRRLLADPELEGVGAVVLDEFHERHLATDLALALVRRLDRHRAGDLALVVMSATLDAEPVARFLGGCPRVVSEGKRFDVAIEHLREADDRSLDKQVVSAVKRIVREGPEGDVLVFLPGAAEIRRAGEALAGVGELQGALVLPLHGDLPMAEQARAVAPADRRKVILSTNVAESSVTIDGVTAVVDSGLARIASHSPWTGLASLSTGEISRASAEQRAGRAGRTAPGRVLRLYTRGSMEARRPHDVPEIQRTDLSEALLVLYGSAVSDPASLEWLDRPPDAAVAAARSLLVAVGAVDAQGAMSPLGRRLLDFPLHPRLGRLLAEAERRGVVDEACIVAALLGERDPRLALRARFGAERDGIDARGDSDLVELLDRFREAEDARFREAPLRAAGLDGRVLRSADRTRRRLRRMVHAVDGSVPPAGSEVEEALGVCVLTAFPDRVALRRRPGGRELVLATGETATLAESSVVHDARLLVAVDAEQRKRGRHSGTLVRLAQGIEPEWLLELPGDPLDEAEMLVWNEARERVERVVRTTYGSITLEERREAASPGSAVAALLAKAAVAAGPSAFGLADVDALAARIDLLRESFPEAGFLELDADAASVALTAACEHATSFDELRAGDLTAAWLDGLDHVQRRLLAEEAPERITLPGGRELPVIYERGKRPWVQSRLQDFFGMEATPRLCRGRVPLTLHLLAPNRRPVQVTSDLAGFWERHYPSLRKQLGRRYPKHAWPEDGRTAKPPPPGRLR